MGPQYLIGGLRAGDAMAAAHLAVAVEAGADLELGINRQNQHWDQNNPVDRVVIKM